MGYRKKPVAEQMYRIIKYKVHELRLRFRLWKKPVLITATISHIQHRQFVAYGEGDPAGAWYFSRKHYNKAVFADKEKALCAFNAFKEDTNK